MKVVYILWAICLCNLSCTQSPPQKLDWLFIYLMSYDNNLTGYSDIILEMSREEAKGKVGAVFCVDTKDQSGIKFIKVINSEIIEEIVYEGEKFDKHVIDTYFSWIAENIDFDNHVITVLNHGGKLDEIALDEYPEAKYVNISDLATSIEGLNDRLNRKAELLFLQVCAKGSLESLYEFKECASYSMFSQTVLQAPNYYYPDVLNDLSGNPNIDGIGIARKIMTYDLPRMYNSYSCIDNRNLDSLAIKLSDFISSISEESVTIDTSKVRSYNYFGETYWDLASLIQLLPNNLVVKQDLLDYLSQKVILINHTKSGNRFSDLTGLFIFSPYNEITYPNLELYKQVNLSFIKTNP